MKVVAHLQRVKQSLYGTLAHGPQIHGPQEGQRLLDLLREDLGLTGTKEGCGEGECGACMPSAPRLRDVRCGADGRQYPLLTVGGGTNRNYKPGDPVQDDFYLQMQGREVFKQAVRSLSAVCSELLEDNGLTLEDIDLFIPHQANLRIIEAVGDRLKLGSEKIFVNLDEYGNTSAASIPLGIGDACAQGRIRPGSRVLLSAFGGGFTWGAALLEF